MFKYHHIETNRFRQETYKILNNIFWYATVTSLLFYLFHKKAFIKSKELLLLIIIIIINIIILKNNYKIEIICNIIFFT